MQINFRALSFLLIVFISASKFSNAQFIVQRSGTEQHLSSVYFSNDNFGWAVGDSGTILRTRNGGNRWEVIENRIKNNINGVAFIDQNLGFIVGDDNAFYKTVDGGLSWVKLHTEVFAHYSAIQFASDSVGFIIGHAEEGGILLKTEDKGDSWSTKIINKDHDQNISAAFELCDYIHFENLSFLDEFTGLIGGYCYGRTTGRQAFLCKTTDGGNTFENLSNFVESDDMYAGIEISSVNFLTPHDAYIVKNSSSNDSFLYTSDFSINSFNPLPNIDLLTDDHFFFNSFFIDRFNGYFTCLKDGKPVILKTMDLGESFVQLNPPTQHLLKGLHFVNINNGYFVGDNGTIIHLIDNNNVVYDYYNDEYTDPPFSFAVPLRKYSKSEIFVYNVNVLHRKNEINVVFYNQFGDEIDVIRSRARISKNEMKIRVKTEDLTHGTYFFTIKLKEKAIVNGKLSIDNFANSR
jgi:photosystem II stability/assembly factor-like uncharacterized protein